VRGRPPSTPAQRPGHRQRPAAARGHPALLHAADPALTPPSPEDPHELPHHLLADTAAARAALLATPIIQGACAGEVSLPSYLAFLREAYHHVRHTVPLLQATKAALPAHHAWLRELDEYIEEEPATTSGSSTTSRPAAAMPRPCATASPATPPR
jgi:hypothetical protein